jgi:hypothetical protein
MEKIIVLSDKQRRSNWLSACIKTLFPECDVITVLAPNHDGDYNLEANRDLRSANTGLKRDISGHE